MQILKEVIREENKLIAKRILNAPRDLAFEVFTNPEHLKHWWGPDGFTLTTQKLEARTGGEWTFMMHGPDGTDYPNKVIYTEVRKPELLSYRHSGDDETEDVSFEVTITFTEIGNQTELNWLMVFESEDELDRVNEKYGAIEGLVQTTARLVEYASTLNN